MSRECESLHKLFNSLKIHKILFNKSEIPLNGLYVLFEESENAHGAKRVVRVGTHTGSNQLPSRLLQHFVNENKDRSIFRKNIGRALLNRRKDSYLPLWEIDLTTKKAKEKFGNLINKEKQKEIEKRVSRYLQENFSFAVIPIEEKSRRLGLESQLISTISSCKDCRPSKSWLGLHSPKEKIRKSGLWQVNEINKQPFSADEILSLAKDLKPNIP